MNEKCLFIGGVADGARMTVSGRMPHVYMPIAQDSLAEAVMESGESFLLSKNVICDNESYTRSKIDVFGKEIIFYRASYMTDYQAISRVFDFYLRKKL